MTILTDRKILACAELAHEANRQYCLLIKDPVPQPWNNLTKEQQISYIKGVKLALSGATPEMQHSQWMEDKIKDGWIYGSVKDEVAKTHPCIVLYHELPLKQKMKDVLFQNTVKMLFDLIYKVENNLQAYSPHYQL